MWRILKKITVWTSGIILGLMIVFTLLLLLFQKKIENYALLQLNNYLKTQVHVFDMEITFWSSFPNVAISFDKVLIYDKEPIPNTKSDTLLYAEKLDLNLNSVDLWKGNYTVKSILLKNARIGLRVSKDGKVNYNILKTNENKHQDFKFSLNKVRFNQLNLTYDNYITQQNFSIYANHLVFKGDFSDSNYNMKMAGAIIMKKIKSKSVVLLKNKKAQFDLTIQVDKKSNAYILQTSTIEIEHIPFALKAKWINSKIDVLLEARNIDLQNVTQNIYSSSVQTIQKLQGKGKVDFRLTIQGNTVGKEPALVQSNFSIHNGSIFVPATQSALTNIQLSGFYSNHQGKNEEIELKQFSFHSKYGNFNGILHLNNFEQPTIKGKVEGGIDLYILNQLFPIQNIKNLNGQMNINAWFHFKMLDPQFHPFTLKIYEAKADIALNNVNIDLQSVVKPIQKLSGKIVVVGDSAAINDLQCTIGKSTVLLNGEAQNYIAYFTGESTAQLNAILTSNYLRLEDFYSNQSPESNYSIGAYILPQHIRSNITLNIQDFEIGKHQFSNVFSNVEIREHQINCLAAQFEHLNANVAGNFSLTESYPGTLQMNGQVDAQQINLQNVFKDWNNFDQKIITANNLMGDAQIALTYSIPYDFRTGLDKKNIQAKVAIKVTNGALKNVETFKQITQDMKRNTLVNALLNKHIDLFQKRLENIVFDTLQNTFTIVQEKVFIPKMSILSSALNIDISGWQSFSNALDYHFDFRLKDLKTTSNNTEFGEIEDDNTGIRLFLHLYGNIGKLKFEWDKAENKLYQKEKWKNEKQTIKSMLKSELGLFKKDSTVTTYKAPEKTPTSFEYTFGNEQQKEEELKQEEKKKKGFFEKLKEKSEQQSDPEFEFDVEQQ